jgi:UDP-3-O-[3-hydroxymyristoyl] glucosamine N-acyltransferase
MYFGRVRANVGAAAVAEALKGKLICGEDVIAADFTSIDDPKPGHLAFVKDRARLSAKTGIYTGMIILAPPETGAISGACVIELDNPRVGFAIAVNTFFTGKPEPTIAPSAHIDPTAQIAASCVVGPNAVIGPNVVVGEDTIIRANVVIGPNVRIGRACLIKSGCIIGEEGFGMEKDENGFNYRIPHHGSVVIGDEVEIGCTTSICAGTIGNTQIDDRVKIDDHVFIAHNCKIGADSLIIACAEISGSVVMGKRVWVGPNAAIINGVSVCDDAFIGISACVTKTIAEAGVYAGVPAKLIRKL